MSQYGNVSKNPPWVRSNQSNVAQVAQALITHGTMPQMASPSMLQYPPVFQGQVPAQMYGSVGAVTYPTRALNSAAFSSGSGVNAGGGSVTSSQHSSSHQASNVSNSTSGSSGGHKQRVFTGTVTKVQDNFGFVDEDVFFQTSCCVKGLSPQVSDRVLVEAVYNPNMPFKWNATRIQVLTANSRDSNQRSDRYQGSDNSERSGRYMGRSESRFSSDKGRDSNNSKRDRRTRDDDDRKRRRDEKSRDRDEKERERQRSPPPPPKKRSKSPRSARRPPARRPPPRYTVIVPKISLACPEGDVVELRKRYANLYIPSDFFLSNFSWNKTFPLGKPMSLNFPCNFHIKHRDVEPIVENDAILEPPDVDYAYSAKVMLLSSPGLEELHTKCAGYANEREGSNSTIDDDAQYSATHPSRMIQFLVGTRGTEFMAIGGPWSPSVDGENPRDDPSVLIKTALRTCKALTGVDLSNCTQWFRFLEVHYHRAASVRRGKPIPARVETVVLFVPDVWSICPTRLEWESTILPSYKKALDNRLNPVPDILVLSSTDSEPKEEEENETQETPAEISVPKREPKHFSELDPKTMKVNELREELEARCLSPKGLKSQISARLARVLKQEENDESMEGDSKKEDPQKTDPIEESTPTKEAASSPTHSNPLTEEKKKDEVEKKDKILDEREKVLLEKRYKMPENPQIIVHPSPTAKSGKFNCATATLSTLLGYRPDYTKEHSFEVSLFAELFNEMLMRDFAFNIYTAILNAPEKPKEEKKEDEKKKEKPKEKDEKDEKDEPNTDEEEVKKEETVGEKKKEEKPKVIDTHLILSFVYFDTTRSGYIYDKDLEDLLFSLGSALSRSQIKKLVQKVTSRSDIVYYKKLAEKVDGAEEANVAEIIDNRMLLAGSETKKNDGTAISGGFVTFNGSVIDVAKLLDQLNKSESTRIETEKALAKVKTELNKLKDSSYKSERYIKDLQIDIRDYKERLTNTHSELSSAEAKQRSYFNALNDINDRIKPIIKSHYDSIEKSRKSRQSASSNFVPKETEVMEIVEISDDNSTKAHIAEDDKEPLSKKIKSEEEDIQKV